MTASSRRSRCAAALLVAFAAVAAVASPSRAGVDTPAVDVAGYVSHVDDGDTLDVFVHGTTLRIRLTGMNTMELTRYSTDPAKWRGECHAVEAAKALYALTFHQLVRVEAQDVRSKSGDRLRRTVYVWRDGAWRNVSELMLAQGHALFLANPVEYAPNKRAAAAAQAAARKGIGLWDTDACGVGPDQAADLRVRVHWDPPGPDSKNVNGEWVRIANRSPKPVRLGGWWLRDSAYRGHLARGFVLPPRTVVPAKGAITVFVGRGTSTRTKLYWGNSAPIFDNVTGSPTYMGDGAYLFDPQGDLRAWQQYPCRYRC